jgi:serine/threonine-protein kinase
VKKAAAAAAATIALGCPTTHVRPNPEPMECPSGALENMEKLGIMGQEARFAFERGDGSAALVKEGWTTFVAWGSWDTEPRIKRLSGKVLFGERVYGRITQATLSDGSTLRVCMELFDGEGEYGGPLKRGAWCEPTSSPDTVRVRRTMTVKPVDHFE